MQTVTFVILLKLVHNAVNGYPVSTDDGDGYAVIRIPWWYDGCDEHNTDDNSSRVYCLFLFLFVFN